MNIGKLITIQPEGEQIGDTAERHTRYRDEIRLFSCVQTGDKAQLLKEFQALNAAVTAGRLSEDELRQYRYLAVSTFTLATRYAIQGGFNEQAAYDFSDRAILQVDKAGSKQEIMTCLITGILELTEHVAKCKTQPIRSPHVRRCIRFINEHFDRKITVEDLAKQCGISADHLTQLFKREIGETPSVYMAREKIERAKEMIVRDRSCKGLYRRLGFSSASHFITVFKKYTGMTPAEYNRMTK